MEPELAEKIYELDRCIECGCCVGGCGTMRMREGFAGACLGFYMSLTRTQNDITDFLRF
jgi:succinate dehydrogenase/fumarate reductase-like Fe-S protein